MKTKRLLLALSLTALAASCQLQPTTIPAPVKSPGQATPSSQPQSPTPSAPTASAKPTGAALSAFVFRIRERFAVQSQFATKAVSEAHQDLIEKAVTEFLADMEAGDVDAYYELPDFAVKLLAGSEGSYFSGAEALASLTSKAASYALALVVDSEGYSAIFKGQFANDSFFFDGADSLPAENTTYLITLDGKLEAQITSGSLSPFMIQAATASPTPTPAATALPTPSPLDLDSQGATPAPPPPQRYGDALAAQQRRGPEYGLVAGRFRPMPPPPPPPIRPGNFVPPSNPAIWPSPEVWERVKRERPAVADAYRSLRGLQPQDHRARLTEIYEANKDIFPVPPPQGPVKPPEEGPDPNHPEGPPGGPPGPPGSPEDQEVGS